MLTKDPLKYVPHSICVLCVALQAVRRYANETNPMPMARLILQSIQRAAVHEMILGAMEVRCILMMLLSVVLERNPIHLRIHIQFKATLCAGID